MHTVDIRSMAKSQDKIKIYEALSKSKCDECGTAVGIKFPIVLGEEGVFLCVTCFEKIGIMARRIRERSKRARFVVPKS